MSHFGDPKTRSISHSLSLSWAVMVNGTPLGETKRDDGRYSSLGLGRRSAQLLILLGAPLLLFLV